MSLLEDVFLEDEAGEAQELERVIEGDEFDERPRTPNSNDDSEKEDEAEEDKRRVDHTAKAKKVVKNPRFVLNPARLTGPRGIQIIPEHFKEFKFKGKGHEREDLDLVLKKLEHWAYRLYPKFKFDDCLKKIETLGKKRPVMVHLHKIRTDQFLSEETVVQQDSSEDEAPAPQPEEDEFDRLLQQQIEIARSTPAPGSVKKELMTPVANRSPLLAPKATSSPSISDEQKERMMRNRKLAEERRLAKLNQMNNSDNNSTDNIQEKESTDTVEKTAVSESDNIDKDDDVKLVKKHNRSNVIDSSDEESDVMTINQSITIKSVEKTVACDSDNIDKDVVKIVKKHNRSNVIDSSDEESDVRTINQSITVDIHDKIHEESDSDKENIELEKNTIESENPTNDVINENDEDKVMETTSNDQDALETNHVEFNKKNHEDTTIENEVVIKVNTANNENASNNDVVDKPKDSSDQVEENLMDVDFTDDF